MSSVQYRTRKGSLLSEEDLIKESKKLGIPVEDIIDKYHLTKTGVNKPQPNYFERTQNNVFSPIDPDQGQNNPRYIDIKVKGRTRRIFEYDYNKAFDENPEEYYGMDFKAYAKAYNAEIKEAKPTLEEVIVTTGNDKPDVSKITGAGSRGDEYKDLDNAVDYHFANLHRINDYNDEKTNLKIAEEYFNIPGLKDLNKDGYFHVRLGAAGSDKTIDRVMTKKELDEFKKAAGSRGGSLEIIGPATGDLLVETLGKEKADDYMKYLETGFLDIDNSENETILNDVGVVVNREKDKLNQNFLNDMSGAEKRKKLVEVFNILGDDSLSIEYADRLKDEREYEEAMKKKWGDKYHPVLGRLMDIEDVYINGKTRRFIPRHKSLIFGGDNPDVRKIIAPKLEEMDNRKDAIVDDQTTLDDEIAEYHIDVEPYNVRTSEILDKIEALGEINSSSDPEKIKLFNSLASDFNKLKDEFVASGLLKQYEGFKGRFNEINKRREEYIKKASLLDDANLVVNAARLNYNNWSRTALQLEKAFVGGGSILLTGTMELIQSVFEQGREDVITDSYTQAKHHFANLDKDDPKYDDDLTREEWLKMTPKDFEVEWSNPLYQQAVDYNLRLSENLEKNYERSWKLGETDAGTFWAQTLADQSPSITAVIGPTTVARLLTQATLTKIFPSLGSRFASEAARKHARKLAFQKATQLTMGSMFIQSGGARLAQSERDILNAPEIIATYTKILEDPNVTPDDVIEYQRIISNAEAAYGADFFQRALTSVLYGGIEMYAEKLGTLKYLQDVRLLRNTVSNFKNPIFRFAHRSALHTWGLAKSAAYGIGIEEMEEVVTQLGQNASDIVIMGEDKSLTEGIDPTFFAKTAMTSLALQGGNIGANLMNIVASEARNLKDVIKNRQYFNELLRVESELQTPGLSGKRRKKLVARKRAIQRAAALGSVMTIQQMNKLSTAEKKALFENARLKRKAIRDIFIATKEGATQEEIDELIKRYQKYETARDQLASKARLEAEAKAKKDKALNPGEAANVLALKEMYDDIAELAALNKGKEFTRISEDDITFIDATLNTPKWNKWRENILEKYGAVDGNKIIKGFEDGNYSMEIDNGFFVYESNRNLAIMGAQPYIESQYAAVSGLHEILHDDLKKMGVDTGGKISRYALQAAKGLFKKIEQKFKDGLINKDRWDHFKRRWDKYGKTGKRNYIELMTLVADTMNMGVIKESEFSDLWAFKSWMHAMLNKTNPRNKWLYPFETPNDIYRYISNFNKKARSGDIKGGGLDERPKTDAQYSRSVNEIYEKEGLVGYEKILAAKRPLIAKWVDKHSQRPDFDIFRDIIIEDALTGPRGVLDLISTYPSYVKEQEKKGEEVASLDAYINNAMSPQGFNRMKDIIDNRLGETFTQSIDRTDQEGKRTTPEPIDYSDKTGNIESVEKQTGELRKLLGIETGGRIYNNVLNEVAETLKTKLPNIQKDPVKFRQELEKRFIKAFTKVVKEKIGTQKSKKFRNFITNEDNIKMLQDLFAIKYKTRAAFSFMTQNAKEVIGGTGRMGADLSRKMQTSLRGSFVSDEYGGNTVWVPVEVTPDIMVEKIIMEIKKSGKPGDTKYKGLVQVLAIELGLDAALDALTNSKSDVNKLKGVIGKVAEAIKRDPTVNFSRSLYAAGRKNPDILVQFHKHKDKFYKELESVSTFDKKGLRPAFNAVWNKEEHPELWEIRELVLNDWAKYLKPFNLTNSDFKKPMTRKKIEDVFDQAIKDIDQNQTLKYLFGIDDISALFNDSDKLKSQERLIKKMLQDLVEEFGPKKGIDIFMMILPQFQDSGRAGDGRYTRNMETGDYVYNESYVKERKKKGRGLQQRFNILENNAKTYEILNLKQYGIVMGKPGKKRIKGKGLVDAIISQDEFFRIEKDKDGNDVYVKVKTPGPKQSADGIQEAMDGNVDMKARKADVKLTRKYLNWQMKWMSDLVKDKSNAFDKGNFAMLTAGLLSNMNTILRRAGLLKYTPEVWNYENTKDYEYEHMIPARVIALFLVEHYFNGNKKIKIDKLFENYDVAIIESGDTTNNKRMNEIVGELYKQRMTLSWMPGDSSLQRYYNEFLMGKNIHAIKNIETGEVHGKLHETVWKGIQNGTISSPKDIQLVNDIVKALNTSLDAPNKGISVIDFDDTLAITDSKVKVTMKDGKVVRWTPAEFAKNAENMADMIEEFDFSEFNIVKKGKKGPFFDKAKALKEKFGNNDIFILTARPPGAKYAIQTFLKGVGLNIKLENIIGLEDGSPQAKANWMIGKVAQGYNDFLFADDQIKNVKAVKAVLDQFDVKSDVRQADANFSKGINGTFNKILEDNKGIPKDAKYSRVVAKRLGAKKGKWQFYLPPNAEDFKGLLYAFLGYGKKGEQQFKFLKRVLIDPYNRGIATLNLNKQEISSIWHSLLKAHPEVKKLLPKLIPGTEFTYDQAIRVWMWNKQGLDIPGLSKRDTNKLLSIVNKNKKLINFANDLLSTRPMKNGFPEPDAYWDVGTLLGDLNNSVERIGRKELLKTFIENKNEIFNEKTLNKIEATYGNDFRESLEDILWRMEHGTNRKFGKNALVNEFMDWINNSVGAVMFINVRSATLQSLSIVNFINWSDNNPMAAAQAFANQPQFWKDFLMIWRSPKLKARRRGLQLNVQEQEIANAAKKGGYKGMLAYLLRVGFTPTQIVDSFAIAFGGASMYRNRVNTYKKQGLDQKAAEEKAFKDFSAIAEETQQSGDPMLISRVQASELGRVIFAWQNTPFQYNRLMKRAAQDLINRRKMPGLTQLQSDATYISKILYYGMVQNFIFSALQNALFAMLPGFTGDEDDDEERQQLQDAEKINRVVHNMADTILRGSGLPGAIISTIKNVIREYSKQEKKGFLADHAYTMGQVVNLSPPLGAKYRKIYGAIQTKKFEKDVIEARGWAPDSPAWEALASVITAATNVPLDRAVMLSQNMVGVTDSRNQEWQRVAMALGWPAWSVGVEIFPEHEIIKLEAKERRKQEGIEKAKRTRELNNRNKTPGQKYQEALERSLNRQKNRRTRN